MAYVQMRQLLLNQSGEVFMKMCRPASTGSGTNGRAKAYFHNPSEHPLVYRTCGKALDRIAEKFPEREAVVSVYQNTRLNFRQLSDKVDQLAAGLNALGLSRGDRLAIWGPNSSEWIISQYAAMRTGIIPVLINPVYQPKELEYCLKKVAAKGLICNETFKTLNYHDMLASVAPEIKVSRPGELRSETLPDLKTVITISENKLPGSIRFSDALAASSEEGIRNVHSVQNELDAEDVCGLYFTSGTTGNPKAAKVTHFNNLNNAISHLRVLEETPQLHRVCAILPFFHIFAGTIVVLSSIHAGNTLVIPSPLYSLQETCNAIQKERCTVCYGTPTMFIDIMEYIRKTKNQNFDSLKIAFLGGAVSTSELLKHLKEVLPGVSITQGYGMTESGPASFTVGWDSEEGRVLKYIGKLLEHWEAKVIGSDGKTLRFGEPGELCVRGYGVCKGYWNDPQKTKELIDESGWLRTGDQVILEEDGYAIITGRLKEIVIRGGENISPKEVEDVVMSHPDVIDAAAFGVADKRLGEELAVALRMRDDKVLNEKTLATYLDGKIAKFKIPKYVIIVEDFPKTSTGKVKKYVLQEETENKLQIKK